MTKEILNLSQVNWKQRGFQSEADYQDHVLQNAMDLEDQLQLMITLIGLKETKEVMIGVLDNLKALIKKRNEVLKGMNG